MSELVSIAELDLTPASGKEYWSCDREGREEFIYFLMVDRFHDSLDRLPVSTPERSKGSGAPERLKKFCGGTIRGIHDHLDYIQGLGCTALWLSPVFENNDDSYHGYAIQNYLDIDRRFGDKRDLSELVDGAHSRNMRVFLDVVLNHSGDNWAYPGDIRCYYNNDEQFEFGYWRREDRPVPVELRDPALYHRRGEIRNFDAYPEAERGDFFRLKDFNNDECEDGRRLQDILIKIHCYWLRELDVDGFRVGSVKNMGERAVAQFCSALYEYSYMLGKRGFFLFGELVGGDDAINRYLGPNTPTRADSKTPYYGLTSVLDYPLYRVLPEVIKGLESPASLMARYGDLRSGPFSHGELARYLVTFIDNHDQIDQSYKLRFAADSYDEQVIAGMGYLLCALGTPCIYYGTEQGFSGQGKGDIYIREAMFDMADSEKNYLNPNCMIYRAISEIARVRREVKALRFGEMYFRKISGNGHDFGFPWGQPCTLAFSRILAGKEILVAYNTSTTEARQDYVIVDSQISRSRMRFLYGTEGEVPVQDHHDGSRSVRLDLGPMKFVILQSV